MNTVKFTKTQDAQPLGDYVKTSVDTVKESATLKLIQVGPKVIDSKIELKGRGIKLLSTVERRYQVTDTAWEKLQQTHSRATDF